MQNLLSTWAALDLRRRLVVGLATAAVFVAVAVLARMASAPGMSLLYAGLDPAVAGQVVAALEQRGVAHAVEGDSIRVDSALRDGLRLRLAAEGLPAAGAAGYELLDGLSGFGTTSQMFDAAYWRAREGELARTVLSMPGVRAARVHIAQAPAQPFQRDRRPTASVTVTTLAGALGQDQARALRHLVAAAVTGLAPADVAIIDSRGGLIAPPEDGAPAAAAEARAAELKRGVERLLAARVGPGRAVVEVSLDLQTEREAVTERRIDPQGRVAISSETESRNSSGSRTGGEVTVASNLPDTEGGAGDRSTASETRERVNYEVSEISRELLRVPGAVRRMTVAVLVDGITAPGADGAPVWSARPDDELAALRDLVASAVGLDPGRGDVLTLHSLPFEAPAPEGTAAEAALPWFGPLDPLQAIQIGALALVALVLGLFVLRPLMAARTAPPPAEPVLALPPAETRVLTGEIDPGFDLPEPGAEDPPEDPVERLRRLIEARRTESLEILRGWMEEGGAAP